MPLETFTQMDPDMLFEKPTNQWVSRGVIGDTMDIFYRFLVPLSLKISRKNYVKIIFTTSLIDSPFYVCSIQKFSQPDTTNERRKVNLFQTAI